MTGVLLIILLLLVIFLAYREGKPFFSDPLKVAILIAVLVLAILAWTPLGIGR